MAADFKERRSDPRSIIDDYFSVNFSVEGAPFVFQFLIWDMSPKGMSLVVREDSEAMRYFKVGKVFNMKYYKTNSSEPPRYLKTSIRHISRDENERFKGHYLVGISIVEEPC
jgi:hypothetical protein